MPAKTKTPKPKTTPPPQVDKGLDPLATLHREADSPKVGRWVDDLLALLPDGVLGDNDARDLTAVGVRMSVADRETILRVLKKCCG
jgi:hypothetical protein